MDDLRYPEMGMLAMASTWMDGAQKTRYPGIYRTKKGYRVRVRVTDPRTGTLKEVNREYENITIQEALAKQQQLRAESEAAAGIERVRVTDFAKSWIESRGVILDENTCDIYTDALEKHVLPALGKYYYDALRPSDVQSWVNKCLRTKSPRGTVYSSRTVRKWYRTFRTMTRDAVAQLDLPRDPTVRIALPELTERDEPNALTPDELSDFLDAMKTRYPQHYALTIVLAFTGLRFCHASALRWEDIDEQKKLIRINRKNYRGRIGKPSRKKRAPRELPLLEGLAKVLREHRERMIRNQEPGIESGWVFPAENGELREPSSLRKAWQGCLKAANIGKSFTVHGLRRTFNDLARRAGVDPIVTKSITGHVTEQMREHYSTVGLDEKQRAVANVIQLVQKPAGGEGVVK